MRQQGIHFIAFYFSLYSFFVLFRFHFVYTFVIRFYVSSFPFLFVHFLNRLTTCFIVFSPNFNNFMFFCFFFSFPFILFSFNYFYLLTQPAAMSAHYQQVAIQKVSFIPKLRTSEAVGTSVVQSRCGRPELGSRNAIMSETPKQLLAMY